MFKHARFVVAIAALALGLAVPAASVGAKNPAVNVAVASSADWTSPSTIIVYVTVSCAPYFSGTTNGAGSVFVNVNQATTGSSASGTGFGSATFACDGQNHKLAVQVQPGPWQLGQAIASATVCGFTCNSTAQADPHHPGLAETNRTRRLSPRPGEPPSSPGRLAPRRRRPSRI